MIYLPFNLIALIMPWMRHKAYFPCRPTISGLPNLKIRSEDQPPPAERGRGAHYGMVSETSKKICLKTFLDS